MRYVGENVNASRAYSQIQKTDAKSVVSQVPPSQPKPWQQWINPITAEINQWNDSKKVWEKTSSTGTYLYQGNFSSTTEYSNNENFVDIVYYDNGVDVGYWKYVGQDGQSGIWIDANWSFLGENLSFIATDLLLANDVIITHALVIGSADTDGLIRSSNYIPDTSGWSIEYDGKAYFNDSVTIGSNGHIKGGQTDYETGTGFYLGYSGGKYKFSIGNDDSFFKFDGERILTKTASEFTAPTLHQNYTVATLPIPPTITSNKSGTSSESDPIGTLKGSSGLVTSFGGNTYVVTVTSGSTSYIHIAKYDNTSTLIASTQHSIARVMGIEGICNDGSSFYLTGYIRDADDYALVIKGSSSLTISATSKKRNLGGKSAKGNSIKYNSSYNATYSLEVVGQAVESGVWGKMIWQLSPALATNAFRRTQTSNNWIKHNKCSIGANNYNVSYVNSASFSVNKTSISGEVSKITISKSGLSFDPMGITSDGTYVYVVVRETTNNQKLWVIKLSDTLIELDQATFSATSLKVWGEDDTAIKYINGYLYVIGHTGSTETPFIMKLNTSLSLIKSKKIAGSTNMRPYGVTENTDLILPISDGLFRINKFIDGSFTTTPSGYTFDDFSVSLVSDDASVGTSGSGDTYDTLSTTSTSTTFTQSSWTPSVSNYSFNNNWDNPNNLLLSDGAYATNDEITTGKVNIQLSKNDGDDFGTVISETFTSTETTETLGSSTTLWGYSWTGANLKNNLVLRVYGDDGQDHVINMEGFDFSTVADTAIVTGIEVNVEAKFVSGTLSIDYISMKVYYGTSETPIASGSMTYASNGRKDGEGAGSGTGTMVYYDGSDWRRTADDTTVVS